MPYTDHARSLSHPARKMQILQLVFPRFKGERQRLWTYGSIYNLTWNRNLTFFFGLSFMDRIRHKIK